MKRFLLISAALLALVSCKKENEEATPEPVRGEITVNTVGTVVLSDEGDSKPVSFSATLDWTASSDAAWLTVNPLRGPAGDASITVSAVENPDYDPRTANLTITCGEASKTVQVTQKQKGALLLTESTISVGEEGGMVTITAKANSNVSAAIDQAAAGWITDVTTKGLVDYVFEFEIAGNQDENARSGDIVFTNETGSETVTIEQAGYQPIVANVIGTVTCGGAPLEGVLVSDGINIVETDASGTYHLQSDKKWKYVFVILPSGYEAPVDGVLPEIWKPLSEEADVTEQVDFELVESSAGDDFTLFVLGDMHLARRTGDLAQFDKVAQFMRSYMDAAPGKVYALTLGDMTWDMYWVANNYGFSDYLQTVNSYFAGIPFFHTMGNHDNEMEQAGDYYKALKYTENLAPDYYSFNLGKIHFIVLDNMDFTGVESGEENRSKYKKNITLEEQEWLRQDLSHVNPSTPIFVTGHEPLARPSGLNWGEELNGPDIDLDTFLGMFAGYNVRFLSGHTHNTFFRRYNSNFVEHNSGAVCASWWWSGYINPGIHIAQDGAPGGFTIWNISGTECTHYYQAALQSPEYQFRAYDMNSVKETITEDLSDHTGYPKYYNHIQEYGDNVILVNVWDYDEDWTVEISENGTPLQVSEVGVYDPLHIYAMTIPRLNNYNTTTFSTAKWCHFFKATASAADTPVTVTVTDRYGNVFTEEMNRPKAFTINEYRNEMAYEKPQAEFVAGTSSSVIFEWTVGGTAAEDAAVPYKLELFRDSACSDLVVSYDVPESHTCWDGNALRFVFGGLQPSTTYYFKVTNTGNGDVSDVVSGRTADFTVVDPADVLNAAAGSVILAEDFSEIPWMSDVNYKAAGFVPAAKTLDPITGTDHSGSFIEYDSTARRLYGDTKVTDDYRLYNWGFFGNSSVYAQNGFLRVGTTQTETARTHIVTPALSGIPAGYSATVDVTVTACMMDHDNDVAVFLEDRSALTLKLAPDQSGSTNPSFSSQGGKYEGASLSNGVALDAPYRELTTKTVRLEGVTATNCLLIGTLNHVSKKNRFWLSDVKVQIVSLEEIPDLEASFGKASSSSLSFTWTEGNGASDDVSKPYTIALYKDAACTDLYVSHNISAGHSCWNNKQPRFVFGGLDQNTDYWFKVTDTTEGDEKVSNVVKATTLPFTRVDASTVSNAGVGDIILGEDFSEVHYGPDEFDNAAGFIPSPHTLEPITGEDPSGSFEKYNSTSTRLWGNGFVITEGTRLSHGWGFYGNSAVYSRVGYFRCATTEVRNGNAARTHIVTPKLRGIPDGYVATIEVTVTDRMYETNGDVGVFVSSNLTMKTTTDTGSSDFGKYTGSGALNNGYALGISTGSWQTKSVTISGVTNQDQLLIGSYESITGSDGKSKNRHNFSDIVVRIVALNDPNRTTKVSIIGDSISTFKNWCDETKGGAYYPKSDCDVSAVSDTWWHRLIYYKMSTGVFEKNISAGNTTVVQNTTGDSGAYWYGWDFGTRLQQKGIGNPDIVIIFGGTNDYGHTLYNNTSEELIDGVEMGAESFPSSSQSRLEELYGEAIATSDADEADALDGSTFCSAYIRLIQMIKVRHPAAKVVCVIGDYLYYGQGQAICRIADLFGDDSVRTVDILSKYGYKANSAIPKYNYAHPTAAGMTKIADEIYLAVGDWIDE
ncbi:MAG: calcineurin-like phosphoesterase C-terminal domain-containing protein [Bacteroidales bacterium]|nr:calcineurin-like phosphoesterase C-terminal domain-containing protein [Bacteroidales bacterium]